MNECRQIMPTDRNCCNIHCINFSKNRIRKTTYVNIFRPTEVWKTICGFMRNCIALLLKDLAKEALSVLFHVLPAPHASHVGQLPCELWTPAGPRLTVALGREDPKVTVSRIFH